MDLDLLDRLARGEFVVVLDDGPALCPPILAAAALAIEPEVVARMVRYTSGFLSVALPSVRCNELRLPALSHDPMASFRVVPAVSVDATVGIGTGISAADRCRTAHVLADANSLSSDLCRPGHVIVMRVPMDAVRGSDPHSRQIFAAMDLCEWGDLAPAVMSSVLVESNGDTMTNSQALEFATEHGCAVVRPESVIPVDATRRSPLESVAAC
jgi:3,4-dihydroxy-2-butanone 4-phosphate synthase